MRRVGFALVVALTTISMHAQSSAPASNVPPQSARQALLEMFMGKGADDFTKHLPDEARQELIHKGEVPETSVVLRISTIGRQMVGQGEHVETFDAGPNILVSEQNGGREKVEVAVEHDSLIGEADEIELAIHVWKDGQLEALPVVPRLTFTLKQENEIWKLTEVTVAAHIPLTDPDYLKGLRKQQNEANESKAKNRMIVIAAAETRYAAQHPEHGYTCTLAGLFAQDPEATAEGESGVVYDPGQGNGEWNGYRFTLAGCSGTPSSKYRVTAEPSQPDSDMKTFCADETGTMKFVAGGKASSCSSRGQVVNSGGTAAFEE